MTKERIEPGPGQESVWDYPRPPRLEESARRIRVIFNGTVIADTRQAKRVLETSHPPVYYIPPEDIAMEYMKPTPGASFCEWKGQAIYYDVRVGNRVAEKAAWAYPAPTERFVAITDHLAFYPSKMDECYVEEELVESQPGDFYGGWITREITGPFKGGAGTAGW